MSWLFQKMFSNQKSEPKSKEPQTVSDPLAAFVPEAQLEELLCFTMGDCELHMLKPKGDKQQKECEFLQASLHLEQMELDSAEVEGEKVRVPVLVVSNDDHDEEQEQSANEKLPLTEDLIFMRYTVVDDTDEEGYSVFRESAEPKEIEPYTAGFAFYYPELNLCKLIECYITTELQKEEISQFEALVCKILYVFNEQVAIREKASAQVLAKQERLISKYCIQTSLDVLLKHRDLNQIFASQLTGSNKEQTAESQNERPSKGRQSKQAQSSRMDAALRAEREAQLVEKMANLKIGQEDLKLVSSCELRVQERMIQVVGHFFKFAPELDKNIQVKSDVFLCIDKVLDAEDKLRYMIHVVDMSAKYSYCRAQISSERAIQLNEKDKVIFWVGDEKPDGSVPAWVFYIQDTANIASLKGILVKTISEMNFRKMQERNFGFLKAQEAEVQAKRQEEEKQKKQMEESKVQQDESLPDQEWLEAQLVDALEGLDLSGSQEALSDYSYDDVISLDDLDALEAQNSKKEELDYYDPDEELELQQENSLEAEHGEGDNTECLQALGYDRAFVVNGPVVKVYKNADEDSIHQRLKCITHLPVLRDSRNEIIEAKNIMLHNNESNLLFIDGKDKNRLINFDLEKGQIVEEYNTKGKLGDQGVCQIVNEFKNAQSSGSQLFQGMNQRNIFTIDPRLKTKDKIAVARQYKTDPMFSSIGVSMGGSLALGSFDGKIRLYKQVGQDAKTLLPGLNDPIIAIEVSRDGNWVLATTQTYLLLVPTLCQNQKTGFEQRMGAEKPNPKKLAIKPQDIAKHSIKNVSFTPAKFNNFNNLGEESSIVATTGNLLVTWNFKKIKLGRRCEYQIKTLEKAPVDSQFRVDHEEKILITEQREVGVQARKKKTKE